MKNIFIALMMLPAYSFCQSVSTQPEPAKLAQTAAVENKAQAQAMKAATVDVGGSGETSRKVYRRADLIKLRMTDPDRYMALQDEIMSAYAQGRVK